MSVVESLFYEQTPTSITMQFVPMRVRASRLEIQLCPGDGGWSLPTGAPSASGGLDDEASRLAASLLGLPGTPVQLGAFGRPSSGVSVVYTHLVRPPPPGHPVPIGSLLGASWWEVRGVRPAPDVEEVVSRAVAKLEYDVEYGRAGFQLVGDQFTVSELRRVHQAVRGLELDPSNFRKRVSRWVDDGIVEELPTLRPTATRPARLYRLF